MKSIGPTNIHHRHDSRPGGLSAECRPHCRRTRAEHARRLPEAEQSERSSCRRAGISSSADLDAALVPRSVLPHEVFREVLSEECQLQDTAWSRDLSSAWIASGLTLEALEWHELVSVARVITTPAACDARRAHQPLAFSASRGAAARAARSPCRGAPRPFAASARSTPNGITLATRRLA